jgi:hypothetical protein
MYCLLPLSTVDDSDVPVARSAAVKVIYPNSLQTTIKAFPALVFNVFFLSPLTRIYRLQLIAA